MATEATGTARSQGTSKARRRGVRDRVVELVRVRAGELVAHPGNWRRHPERQRAALRGILREIGYADALLARREGESFVLIDGHLRKSLDRRRRARAPAPSAPEARLDAEVRVFRERPLAWLSRVARSAPELPGRTELPKEQDSSPSQDLAELIKEADEEVGEERERYQQASCSDDDCECQFHIRRRNGERHPPELR